MSSASEPALLFLLLSLTHTHTLHSISHTHMPNSVFSTSHIYTQDFLTLKTHTTHALSISQVKTHAHTQFYSPSISDTQIYHLENTPR